MKKTPKPSRIQNSIQRGIQNTASSGKALDWSTINTVLLDMDGTLLDLHFDNYFWLEHLPKRYAEHHKLDYQEAREKLHKQIQAYEGTLQWYCLDHWSELVQMDIPALKREVSHRIRVRPHSETFLKFLKSRHLKVILVTNAHRSGLKIKLEIAQIDQWLDIVVSSHDYQIPKEDPEFWLQLQANEGFDPQHTLFIDDTPRIVARAGEFGIKHLVCITHPDSSQSPRLPCNQGFIYINDFDELM
jgi:putative hydrolase of the HAD superfamily